MCKKIKFDHTKKWHLHNPAPVLENDTHKLVLDFNVHTDQQIGVRRPDLIIINKKEILQNRGSLNKVPHLFLMDTFIDSTHYAHSDAMHLLGCSKIFWKAPWNSSCVSVSMTFIPAFFYLLNCLITTASGRKK